MTLNLNDKQVVILKSLLSPEIDYLEKEAIPGECIFRIIPARHLGNCRPLPKGR